MIWLYHYVIWQRFRQIYAKGVCAKLSRPVDKLQPSIFANEVADCLLMMVISVDGNVKVCD